MVVLLCLLSCTESRWQRWKNTRAKMKLLWKQYGLVWIGTFTVLYIGMLGGVYVVLDTGLVASDVSSNAQQGTVISRSAEVINGAAMTALGEDLYLLL